MLSPSKGSTKFPSSIYSVAVYTLLLMVMLTFVCAGGRHGLDSHDWKHMRVGLALNVSLCPVCFCLQRLWFAHRILVLAKLVVFGSPMSFYAHQGVSATPRVLV